MSGLTREDIEDILKLIDGSSYDELRLEMGDLKLELRKSGVSRAPLPDPDLDPVPTRPASPLPQAAKANPEGLDVPAPLLGTFYHAAKPGASPFVQVGDRVTPDTVIGIIEVMKLMNQVEAGVAGIVTEICAPNGELVEHGQCLLRVKPA